MTIDIIAIIAILVPLITALLTWLSARKTTDVDLIKSDRVVAVEALQKAGELAVQVAEKQAEDWEQCVDNLTKAREENAQLKILIVDFKMRLKARAMKIRAILNRHTTLRKEIEFDCPGYDTVQGMLEEVAKEIDEEAKSF
jgi:hypothetical protein